MNPGYQALADWLVKAEEDEVKRLLSEYDFSLGQPVIVRRDRPAPGPLSQYQSTLLGIGPADPGGGVTVITNRAKTIIIDLMGSKLN